MSLFFFFNDTATTEIYTLSLHDALPILVRPPRNRTGYGRLSQAFICRLPSAIPRPGAFTSPRWPSRSEEHTSELQSRLHLVCRLLLEKKKKITVCQLASPAMISIVTIDD